MRRLGPTLSVKHARCGAKEEPTPRANKYQRSKKHSEVDERRESVIVQLKGYAEEYRKSEDELKQDEGIHASVCVCVCQSLNMQRNPKGCEDGRDKLAIHLPVFGNVASCPCRLTYPSSWLPGSRAPQCVPSPEPPVKRSHVTSEAKHTKW